MNTNIKYKFITVAIFTTIFFVIFSDIIEAQTQAAHMHRATRRRTAIVVSSVTHEKDQEAAAAQKQQDEEAQKQADDEKAKETSSTTPPPPVTDSPNGQLPIGTVVNSLPEGCVSKPVNNVEYYQCGPNYYKVAYQGSNLVYVTTDPPISDQPTTTADPPK